MHCLGSVEAPWGAWPGISFSRSSWPDVEFLPRDTSSRPHAPHQAVSTLGRGLCASGCAGLGLHVLPGLGRGHLPRGAFGPRGLRGFPVARGAQRRHGLGLFRSHVCRGCRRSAGRVVKKRGRLGSVVPSCPKFHREIATHLNYTHLLSV